MLRHQKMGSNQTQEFFFKCTRMAIMPILLPPANEFAKVMLLHVSVSPQGGVPGQVHPLGRYNPWVGTPPGQVHPLGAGHAERYGQQAGGTHPTRMHSCIIIRGYEKPGSIPTGVIFFTGFFLVLRNKASDANIGIIVSFV